MRQKQAQSSWLTPLEKLRLPQSRRLKPALSPQQNLSLPKLKRHLNPWFSLPLKKLKLGLWLKLSL